MADKKSILVIGSDGHRGAERCVSWGDEDFSISDFDIIIVDTTSLNEHILASISQSYFTNLKDRIVESQIAKKLEVICITSKLLYRRKKDWDDDENTTNYHWCPVIPILEEQTGSKIKTQDLKRAYKKFIKGWSRLLVEIKNNTGYTSSEDFRFRYIIEKLTTNQADRAIAFSICWYFDGGKYNEYAKLHSNTSILFLPEIANTKEGIDSLIEEELGQAEEPAPAWVEEISISGEKEIRSKIEAIRAQIITLLKGKKDEEEALSKLEKYKKLLYLKGIPLQDIVIESFSLLGIKIDSPKEANEEDGYFPTEAGKLYFEVRGKDSSGLVMNDVSQMIGRIGSKGEHKSEKYKTWGVIVLNHDRMLPPQKRKKPYEQNLVDKAKPFNIALLTTWDLFKLVSAKLEGKAIVGLAEALFNTIGVFDIDKVLPREEKPKPSGE